MSNANGAHWPGVAHATVATASENHSSLQATWIAWSAWRPILPSHSRGRQRRTHDGPPLRCDRKVEQGDNNGGQHEARVDPQDASFPLSYRFERIENNCLRTGERQMRLNISGLNELRERLERLRPEEAMARALAEQAERMAAKVRDGLSEPPGAAGHDEPWLQSGALRDSVGVHADGLQAAVGSSDPAAVPQEMGTARMPARPFLGLIRKHPNRVACDHLVRGFPLLERFVMPFG